MKTGFAWSAIDQILLGDVQSKLKTYDSDLEAAGLKSLNLNNKKSKCHVSVSFDFNGQPACRKGVSSFFVIYKT